MSNIVEFTGGIPVCPYCKEPTNRVRSGPSTSTCVGWIKVYDKDGKQISKDPNTHTSSYSCMKCRNTFSVKSTGGVVSYGS